MIGWEIDREVREGCKDVGNAYDAFPVGCFGWVQLLICIDIFCDCFLWARVGGTHGLAEHIICVPCIDVSDGRYCDLIWVGASGTHTMRSLLRYVTWVADGVVI